MASIKLKGDTSGEVTIQAPAVAGTTTLNIPAVSGNILTDGQALPAIDGSALTGISAGPILKYITDSTDIAVTATADSGYSTIGSTFSVDIPTSGYIAMKNLVIKLINDETSHYSMPVFGLRISSTNYWFTKNESTLWGTYYAPVTTSQDNTVTNYTIINAGPHSGWSYNGNNNAFGTNFNADIIRLGIPTGTQTAQLIVASAQMSVASAIYDGDFTIKGTDVTTRVGLEFMAVS
jgi:hypothetical protein